MQKDLTVGVLNEIYGKFLTARQSEIVSQYYDYDLSLQEISENLGISRQAVLDAVKKGSEQLYRFEKELKVFVNAKFGSPRGFGYRKRQNGKCIG